MNNTHKENVNELKQEYKNAQPFPHIQISEFLGQDAFEKLVHSLSNEQFEHKENDLFSLAQTQALQNSQDETIQEFITFMNSKQLREWMKKLTDVQTTPGELDIFGAIYQDTDYLLPHDDQLEDRKIAWILYLTTLTPEQGGALALYDEQEKMPNNTIKAYQPIANSLALFTVSPESWHEVEEVTDQTHRVSIGGWLK